MKIRSYYKQLFSFFLQGLLLIGPIFLTLYSIFAVFNMFDTKANDWFEYLFHFRFPGLGLLVMIALITFIGYIGSTVLLQPVMHGLEMLLEKTPLVKDIYSSIKDFVSAFLSNKKKFNKPVVVEMGRNSGIYKMGFITDADLSEFQITDKVAVYFPHSYNFSGNLYLVNKDQVQPLQDVRSADVMKYIVSGGVMEIDEEDGRNKK
ncbi:MAG: DUF502 domain-containing protein [Chitinophagales bacterium]